MTRALLTFALLFGLATPALAQGVPAEIAAALRQIGPVIDPPATARLYAPLQPFFDKTFALPDFEMID